MKRDTSELLMSKKTKKGLPSYKLSSLNIVKLSNDTDHKPYTMFPSKRMVNPKVWELPNRKRFYNWTYDTFKKYDYGRTKSGRRQSSIQVRRR